MFFLNFLDFFAIFAIFLGWGGEVVDFWGGFWGGVGFLGFWRIGGILGGDGVGGDGGGYGLGRRGVGAARKRRHSRRFLSGNPESFFDSSRCQLKTLDSVSVGNKVATLPYSSTARNDGPRRFPGIAGPRARPLNTSPPQCFKRGLRTWRVGGLRVWRFARRRFARRRDGLIARRASAVIPAIC